jgi:two-component system, NarL family, invasion response regulator UvrY
MSGIVIADPSFLAREGFKRILDGYKSYRIIGEIKNNRELWFKLSSLNPKILVLDYSDRNFLEPNEITKIKDYVPSSKILVISNHDDKQNILNVIKQGAIGYLTKECEADEIYKALDTVSKGEKFFCSKVIDIILEKHYEPNKKNGSAVLLSDREIEIIKLIVEGNSNQDIADKLFLSIHTVYTHRKNMMKKLKLKSPVELILYALNSGLTES